MVVKKVSFQEATGGYLFRPECSQRGRLPKLTGNQPFLYWTSSGQLRQPRVSVTIDCAIQPQVSDMIYASSRCVSIQEILRRARSNHLEPFMKPILHLRAPICSRGGFMNCYSHNISSAEGRFLFPCVVPLPAVYVAPEFGMPYLRVAHRPYSARSCKS